MNERLMEQAEAAANEQAVKILTAEQVIKQFEATMNAAVELVRSLGGYPISINYYSYGDTPNIKVHHYDEYTVLGMPGQLTITKEVNPDYPLKCRVARQVGNVEIFALSTLEPEALLGAQKVDKPND